MLFLIFSGIGFNLNILFLPLIIIAQFLLLLGIIFITSSVNLYIRDLEYIINFFVTMLFYATPILYSEKLFFGSKLSFVFKINPMAAIINSYRDIFYYKQIPNLTSLFIVILFSLLLSVIGLIIFEKLGKGFAEEV